jgi:hypothetical protein
MPLQGQAGQEFRSGILVKKLRRLAIRAAQFEPEADYATWTVSKINSDGISVVEKKTRGLKGPIRIPLHSQLFLFNALAFPSIPSKSLKFRTVVFSIPTAPTNHPFSQQQLSDLSRRQKAAISLKGGTHGSNERIPAVLHQSRSLDSASTHCFISKNAVSGP